jgi:hypothetical protein
VEVKFPLRLFILESKVLPVLARFTDEALQPLSEFIFEFKVDPVVARLTIEAE